MPREFRLPDLGEGIHEGEVVDVLVQTGAEVKEEQAILVVETDKAAVEIPSPYSGKVTEIRVKKGDIVQVGDVMLVFDGGEGALLPEAVPPTPAEAQPAAPAAAEAKQAAAPQPVAQREGPVPAAPSTRRLARELGVDLALVPPSGPAGLVTAEDVRSFAEGRAAMAPVAPSAAPAPAAPAAAPAPSTAPPLPDPARWGQVERVALRSVRRATARHMALAWSQIPHVNHQDLADITELEALRGRHKNQLREQGGSLTLTVFLLKAVVAALKAFPRLNASLDTATEEIVLKHYYHIGVATDTDRGLLVPVIRNVDRKSMTELAMELPKLVERTQAGQATLEEMQGGTFTITNIGILGGTGFAPIVNYPEVAILGVGKAKLQPVIRGDEHDLQVVPRLMLPLVLAFDHRVNDGADAARFMNRIIEMLEDPNKLMLNA